MSLFDDWGLAEITSQEYPGERLIVCKNPFLAQERKKKRRELEEKIKSEEALDGVYIVRTSVSQEEPSVNEVVTA